MDFADAGARLSVKVDFGRGNTQTLYVYDEECEQVGYEFDIRKRFDEMSIQALCAALLSKLHVMDELPAEYDNGMVFDAIMQTKNACSSSVAALKSNPVLVEM